MKKILCLIVIVSAIISCNSEEKTPAADATSIIKDSSKYTTIQWEDTAIDFGTKKMGEVVNLTFKCKNTGDKPLYLVDVHPSCGCTLVDYTKAPIAPGKEGSIEAKFDTKNHPGVIHKTVMVTANNSNYAPSALKFSGFVLSDSTASN